MLGGADTKKSFLLKMIDGAGIKKVPISQYVRRYWHEKAVSTENARRGSYKRSSLNSIMKELFLRKMPSGAGVKKAQLT